MAELIKKSPAVERAWKVFERDLRQEKDVRFETLRLQPGLVEFLNSELLAGVEFEGYKQASKQELARQLLTNAILAERASKVVGISRSNKHRLRSSIFDKVLASKLVVLRKGSEDAKLVTRYAMNRTPLRAVKAQNFQFHELVNTAVVRSNRKLLSPAELEYQPVILHQGDGDDKKAVRINRMPAHIEELGTRILEINDANLNHSFKFYRVSGGRRIVDQPNVSVRAIFTRDFEHGGRLFAQTVNGYTHLSVEERRTMEIDGKKIAEMDFSGHLPRMLYHRAGVDFEGRDIYQPERILPELSDSTAKLIFKRDGLNRKQILIAARSLVKTATVTCLNAKNQKQANSAIGMELSAPANADLKRAFSIVGIDLTSLSDRILDAHAVIRDRFFNDAGLLVQASDEVPLLLDILQTIHAQGLPALGLHDGVICRKSDRKLVRTTMESVYEQRFGIKPIVKRDF